MVAFRATKANWLLAKWVKLAKAVHSQFFPLQQTESTELH